jgi:anti-sigma factor RsiW
MTAAGGFDAATWQSTGIGYAVEVSSDASLDQLAHLLKVVDQLDIPRF